MVDIFLYSHLPISVFRRGGRPSLAPFGDDLNSLFVLLIQQLSHEGIPIEPLRPGVVEAHAQGKLQRVAVGTRTLHQDRGHSPAFYLLFRVAVNGLCSRSSVRSYPMSTVRVRRLDIVSPKEPILLWVYNKLNRCFQSTRLSSDVGSFAFVAPREKMTAVANMHVLLKIYHALRMPLYLRQLQRKWRDSALPCHPRHLLSRKIFQRKIRLAPAEASPLSHPTLLLELRSSPGSPRPRAPRTYR